MLTSHRVIKAIGDIVGEASEAVIKQVFSMHHDIKGKEEEITAQIASEITLHLCQEIESKLNGRTISGVKFRVYVFRKKEESHIGADLAGVLTLNLEGKTTTKMYLAQAKVGQVRRNTFDQESVYVRDSRLLEQVDKMLAITPDSYVFLYSRLGVQVLSAHAVRMLGRGNFSTDDLYAHGFGWFYQEFFKCFLGDHRFTDIIYNGGLAALAKRVSANKVLMISGMA